MKVNSKNLNEVVELYSELKRLNARKHLLKINLRNLHARCYDEQYVERYPRHEQDKYYFYRDELRSTIAAIAEVKARIWNIKHPLKES